MSKIPDEFDVEVEGEGNFRVYNRTMAREFKIQAEHSRLLDGTVPTNFFDQFASWFAVLKVLIARAPSGFVLDELDPLDESSISRIYNVFYAIHEKELSFRGKSKKGSAEQGQGKVEVDPVLVPGEVQSNGE